MKRVVFFDIEGTGLDTQNDRIVEIAFYNWQGSPLLETRVNPGVPIPEETTAIHGISDADVVDAPSFREIAPRVEEIIEGNILAGYNSRRYDVPILDAELQRAGREGLPRDENGMIDVPEIDLFAIWGEIEPRTLVGAAKRFAGVDLEDAHSAGADTAVLPQVMRGMMDQILSNEAKDPTVDRLQELSVPEWAVDRDGKFRREEDGTIVFNFSQKRGQPATSDPGLLAWMLRKDFSTETKAWARRLHGEAMQPASSELDDDPGDLPF